MKSDFPDEIASSIRNAYGDLCRRYNTDEADVAVRSSATNEEIMTLASWECNIEDHYNKPMDIEWAKDGNTDELFIVQARPETVHSQKGESVLKHYRLNEKGKSLMLW